MVISSDYFRKDLITLIKGLKIASYVYCVADFTSATQSLT